MKNSPFKGKKVKVLLIKPLLGKGQPGDVIEVKTHYALYVLVPNGTAVIYDQQVQNQKHTQAKRIEKVKAEEQKNVTDMINKLNEQGGITFTKQATEEDNLYDSITNRSLLAYITKEFGVNVQPSSIQLTKIESLGEYTADFTYQDIQAQIPIKVVRETV